MRLPRTPAGGVVPVRSRPPARPNVIDDGDELEVVWFPHRDAESLLPECLSRALDAECPVRARYLHLRPMPVHHLKFL